MNTENVTNEKSGNDVLPRVRSRFIAITYMIYIILWEALVIGGCGYVVFGLNRSGWWMLLGVLLSVSAYKPSHWKKLFS